MKEPRFIENIFLTTPGKCLVAGSYHTIKVFGGRDFGERYFGGRDKDKYLLLCQKKSSYIHTHDDIQSGFPAADGSQVSLHSIFCCHPPIHLLTPNAMHPVLFSNPVPALSSVGLLEQGLAKRSGPFYTV
jgi:hypothetical protein